MTFVVAVGDSSNVNFPETFYTLLLPYLDHNELPLCYE